MNPYARSMAARCNFTFQLSLEAPSKAWRLAQRLTTLDFPSLPMGDEIGYLPVSIKLVKRATYGRASFQLLRARELHAARAILRDRTEDERIAHQAPRRARFFEVLTIGSRR